MIYSHNGELFSKNAFSAGKYKTMDMSELNMTNERDYAAYLALMSSGQGKNNKKAEDEEREPEQVKKVKTDEEDEANKADDEAEDPLDENSSVISDDN